MQQLGDNSPFEGPETQKTYIFRDFLAEYHNFLDNFYNNAFSVDFKTLFRHILVIALARCAYSRTTTTAPHGHTMTPHDVSHTRHDILSIDTL